MSLQSPVTSPQSGLSLQSPVTSPQPGHQIGTLGMCTAGVWRLATGDSIVQGALS